MLDKLEKKLIAIFNNFSAILLGGIMLFVMLAVLDRSIFKIGFYWTEEMARTFFIWFSMFTPAIMISAGTQFALDYFKDKLLKKKRIHAIWNMILALGMLAASATLVFSGIEYVIAMKNQTMPTIGAPIAVMYLSLPFGMACISIMLVLYIIRVARGVIADSKAAKNGLQEDEAS